MELTPNLAARLVKKLESVQPYDVVLINREGIIIAATDAGFIGKRHPDAYARIREHLRQQTAGASPKIRDRGNGRCLFVRNQLVGAVGLSGRESKVVSYLEMAKTIAEMFLEREFEIQSNVIQTASQMQVLRRLISDHYDQSRLKEVLSAHSIDVTIPRTLLAIRFSPMATSLGQQEPTDRNTMFQDAFSSSVSLLDARFSFQDDMILPDGETHTVFVFCADRSQVEAWNEKQIEQLCHLVIEDASSNYRLAASVIIGKRCCALADYNRQYTQLMESFKMARDMFPQLPIIHGKRLVLSNITSYVPDEVKQNVISHTFSGILSSAQRNLYLDTLNAFFENDMNIGETAKSLFIHRNTLQYRFKKIEELTGYCMYKLDDVLSLRLAYLFYRMLNP